MNLAAAVTDQQIAIIQNQTPDVLMHKDSPCCHHARIWLQAMARSFDFSITDASSLSGPGWLRQRYNWGPSPWPIHWCEAVNLTTIDCGLFRAFAVEIFRAKGVEAWPAQVLREQQEHATRHWVALWEKLPGSFQWAARGFVYHEVVAVRTNGHHCRIYDPTDGNWIDRTRVKGHNGHFAVRVESPEFFDWQGLSVGGFKWLEL